MGMSGFCRVPHPVVTRVLVALACLAVAGFARAGAVSPGVQGCRALIQAPQSASGGIPVTITDDSVAPTGATLTSRAWFFGDGVSLSGRSAAGTVDHLYPVPVARMRKTYEIRLLLSYSNGVQCSASTSILIMNSAQQKGFTRLGLRGSTASTTIAGGQAPGMCGALDATMTWIPRFGIVRSDFPYPVLQLFGTAVITSGGVTQRDPDTILVVLNSRRVFASDPRYVSVAELNRIVTSHPCTLRIRLMAAQMASGFSFAPADIRSGTAKLKCKPATASAAPSCKIDPSKTLHVTGTWGNDAASGKVDLHIHFAKETCSYLGPAKPSPLSAPRARWYKCSRH